MRIAFLFFILAASVYYTYVAFVDLSFLTRSGRLGPGFFPRLVGLSMVAFTIWALIDALREGRNPKIDSNSWSDVLKLMALGLGYAILLRLLGGFPATVIYLGLALLIMNPGKYLQNAILTVVIPSAIFLLFDGLLNANMPPALLNLPF
jgi:hypothetical protein